MSEEIDTLSFLKIHFTFMCMHVLHACIYVYCTRCMPLESPRSGVQRVVRYHGGLEIKAASSLNYLDIYPAPRCSEFK